MNIIPPFNEYFELNLKIGTAYKLHINEEEYKFTNKENTYKGKKIKNGTILLFVDLTKTQAHFITKYGLHFFVDGEIVIYSVPPTMLVYECHFEEVV